MGKGISRRIMDYLVTGASQDEAGTLEMADLKDFSKAWATETVCLGPMGRWKPPLKQRAQAAETRCFSGFSICCELSVPLTWRTRLCLSGMSELGV